MVEVLHPHSVPEAGPVDPPEAGQHRQPAVGQPEKCASSLDAVGALRYLSGEEPETRGPGLLGVPRGQEPVGALPERTVVERVDCCLARCRVQPRPVEHPPW